MTSIRMLGRLSCAPTTGYEDGSVYLALATAAARRVRILYDVHALDWLCTFSLYDVMTPIGIFY